METTPNEPASDWHVVGPAWSSVRAAALGMKPLFISAGLASLLLSAFEYYEPGWIGGQSRPAAALTQFAIVLLILFLRLLILAPVAVAVHRLILLDERTPGIISLRPVHTRRFALWLAGFSLAIFIIILVTALSLSIFGAFGKLLFFISIIVTLVCSIFSALVFPAIAVEEPSSGWRERLAASWRRMEGHFWFFIGTSIVTVLPVVLLELVLAGVLAFVQFYIFHGFPARSPLLFAIKAIIDLNQILTAMLGAAIASRFYARFRDQRPDSETPVTA